MIKVKNERLRILLISIFITIISFIIGIVFKGGMLGTVSLIIGFLNAYYMSIGKWYNYIFAFVFSVIYAYICFVDKIYGCVIISILFFIPMQIIGLINWFTKLEESEITPRSLSLKNGIVLVLISSITSFLFGYLLTLIPNQNVAFLDATSQIFNIIACVLGLLRYREVWYVWLLNNILDLSIWIYCFVVKEPHSLMMLLTSIMYFLMNIYGLISWIKLEKQKYIKKSS